MGKSGNLVVALAFAAVCGVALYMKFGRAPEPDASGPASANTAAPAAEERPSKPVEVLFASSDGKKEWVNDAVQAFNAKNVQVGGRKVVVKAQHMRSGESRKAILEGREKPTIWGPAGRSWIDLIDRDWTLREKKPFLTDVRDTVQTALVIALWEPMARALGWPDKAIGWADLQKVALNPKGWAAYGHPEWGPFRFGHSHPDYSNSAMLSFVSMIYASAGKTSGLTAADMKRREVVSAVSALERAIVHYGESSSWLTEKLCARGPAYLSAVTLYESSVVKANEKYPAKPFRIVAVYPKEGTFWEAHPAGIVNADWVSPEQREGAKLFLDFLASKEQQQKAPRFGFRPALSEVPLTAPFDAEHGVDPTAERRELAYVDEELFSRANDLWHQVKKKAAVWVLLDKSGSMQGDPMEAAKRGCSAFLKKMEPDDVVRLIAFNTEVNPLGNAGKVREVGEELVGRVEGLFAEGQTQLYDAIAMALDEIEEVKKRKDEDRQYGIVVLSDGKDTSSRKTRRPDLLEKLPRGEDTEGTRIFTIGYGKEADEDLLREVSERSNAVMTKGSAADVEKIYHQLASYF